MCQSAQTGNIKAFNSAIDVCFCDLYGGSVGKVSYPVQRITKILEGYSNGGKKSFSWWKDDEQLRVQKANNPLSSWGMVINGEFWLLYVNSGISTSFFVPTQYKPANAQSLQSRRPNNAQLSAFTDSKDCLHPRPL